MLILQVHAHVKPEGVEAFRTATVENARQSRREPGVVRFDVVQQLDDPTHFVLVEVYRDAAAQGAHKETRHYQVWAAAVADLLAEPRTRATYTAVDPPAEEW
jgi:quinol monooxygenase YgiN